ncbi:MAG: hypothetical protein AAGI07_07345 [Bacteroidota bacterium]
MNKEEPEKMEDIDWDALEAEDRLAHAGKDVEDYDKKAIDAEKEKLSEEEKTSPYPDDFLADINLLNKEIKKDKPKLG